MRNHRFLTALMLIGFALTVIDAPVQAQDKPEQEDQQRGSIDYSFSYTPAYLFKTDLDNGGDFDVNSHDLRLKLMLPFHRQWRVGLGLSYDYEDWNFDDLSRVAGAATPWSAIHRPAVSLPIAYTYSNDWTLSFSPTLGYSGEAGAGLNDSLVYGAVASLIHPFSRDLFFGLGVGIFNLLEETRFSPFIAVNWRITDQIRISNPFEAGPAGPAGLELVYSPTEKWELGVGGAYRSYRFRLDEDSSEPGGIGENEFLVGFLRIQRRLTKRWKLDFVGGALFEGKLSIENADGDDIQSDRYNPAPIVALTFSGQF